MEQRNLTGYPSIDKPWLKYYSEEAINAPLPENTVYGYMKQQNADNLAGTALTYYGRRVSYAELLRRIDETAAAFAALGVKENNVVSFCMPTTPEIVYAFYALNKLGAVANLIDLRTNAANIQQYVASTRSKVLVTLDLCLPKVQTFAEKAGVERVIVVSVGDSMPLHMRLGYKLIAGKDAPAVTETASVLTWARFVRLGADQREVYAPPYVPRRAAAIVYTGGTTGLPKGAVLSNDNFNTMVVLQKYSRTRMERGLSFLDIMPPFIAYGLVCGIANPLALGMNIIIIPKFVPANFDKLILKYKPNHAIGVPSYFESLANSERMRNADLSFIENFITGGDKIVPATEALINEFLLSHQSKYKLHKGYGMTELSSTATYSVCDECNLPGSVGIPLFSNNVKIVEPGTQKELPYNEMGEICMTSPTMILGYFGNEEATQETFVLHADGQRWIHTQDIGYMNEDGVLFIVDRMKRVIARPDGHKVWPSQIESVIAGHAAVAFCAVVGLPNPSGENGRIPTAFIVLREGVSADRAALTKEINELCLQHLSEWDMALAYHYRDSLPLTPIGKVDFLALEWEATQTGGQA